MNTKVLTIYSVIHNMKCRLKLVDFAVSFVSFYPVIVLENVLEGHTFCFMKKVAKTLCVVVFLSFFSSLVYGEVMKQTQKYHMTIFIISNSISSQNKFVCVCFFFFFFLFLFFYTNFHFKGLFVILVGKN